MAAGVERDADLHGLPEGSMVAVAGGAGVAQNPAAALGNQEPVGAGVGELPEPVAPLADADRPRLEVRDRIRRRVVENFYDLGEVVLGPEPDLDGGGIGSGAPVRLWCPIHRAIHHAGTVAGGGRDVACAVRSAGVFVIGVLP